MGFLTKALFLGPEVVIQEEMSLSYLHYDRVIKKKCKPIYGLFELTNQVELTLCIKVVSRYLYNSLFH